jgi:small subunit ribosomal protein S20
LPGKKSSRSQARSIEKKNLRNKAMRSRGKGAVAKAEKLIAVGKLETAQGAVVAAVSALDKAAEKGIIHPNNAARRKSRLMHKLNKAQAA